MTEERLNKIFDKTDGYCHLCHKKLAFTNYGINGARGSWHIEHSIPKAKDGTDHLNNLFPACISCNLEKGVRHTKTIRKNYGVTRAPYNKAKKDKIRSDNALAGGTLGMIISAFLGGGPLAVIACTVIGAKIGGNTSVKR
jgi:hypothetical protein